MARTILSAVIFLAGLGLCQAETPNCYPRIGAYSGQYEGQCPNSGLKWTAIENTLGAFGRNCNDEPWTYNRNEGMFYNLKANEKSPMRDCYEPGREQMIRNIPVSLNAEEIRRFHGAKARPAVTLVRQAAVLP